MDKLLTLPPQTRIHPGHTDPTTVADELEHNRFVRIWRGARPRGRPSLHRARRAGHADPARRRLRRRPQGVGPLARRVRRHRPGLARRSVSSRRTDASRYVAKDKIPTSRVGRTAKIGGLAAGQAIRQAGTRAANVARSDEGKKAALERRHIEAAEQIVDRAGDDEGRRDEGRAGDVVPRRRPRARGVPRGVPAQARRAARRRARRSRFKDMRKVIEEELDEPLERGLRRVRRGADRGRLDRPGLPRDGCTTAARSRSRSSTRASPPRSAPTCRTSG